MRHLKSVRPSHRMTSAVVVSGIALTLAALSAAAQPVSDEVIVQFISGSEPDTAVGRASVDGGADPSVLDAVVARLRATLQFPFYVSRLASGRQVIVALDRPSLMNLLMRCLERRGYAPRQESLDPAGSPPAAAWPTILVDVTASAGASNGPADTGKEPNRTGLTDMENECGVPLHLLAQTGQTLSLQPDEDRLTAKFTAALRSAPDVQFAQPNYRKRVPR